MASDSSDRDGHMADIQGAKHVQKYWNSELYEVRSKHMVLQEKKTTTYIKLTFNLFQISLLLKTKKKYSTSFTLMAGIL